MTGLEVFSLTAFLAGGMGLVTWLIAADPKRFLARFDLGQWRPNYYLRALPNFLQALHDHHFKTPWPARRNAVSATYFRYRARPLLRRHSAVLRRAFLQQHVVLFGLLEVLRPYLRDFILNEQQRIVGNAILSMEDTVERDRLIAFLEWARGERTRFARSLTGIDRETISEIVDRQILQTLKAAHSIFQEHGYSLMGEFTQLRRWAEMTGTELVQELPVMTRGRSRRERWSTTAL